MAPHILLLSDDAVLREVLHDILTEAGYAVLAGAPAHLAPPAAQAHAPQVILFDYFRDPAVRGPGPGAWLATDPALAAVPVILLTDQPCAAPPALPRLEVLPKPFDLDALLARVAARV